LGVHNVDVVMEEQADINMTGGGFTTLTYIGMGSQRAITGVGFKPDILWLKARDDIGTASFYDNVLYSNGIGSVNYYSVSGDIYLSDFLYMNETNPLGTMNKGRLLHYDEDGFTLSSDNGAAMNITGRKYTAFAWSLPNIRENVSPSGDVQEITPIWEKYSQSMGVSMIEYQGNGRAISKITHSLGKKPEMIMIKNISEHGAWMVYHDAVGSENFLQLNEKNPSSALSSVWSNTEPTSQIFFIGNHENVNKAGKRYVAYLFTTRAGYSKIGSYTGDGTHKDLELGFSPDFFMVKRVDAAGDWWVIDSASGIGAQKEARVAVNVDNQEIDDWDVAYPLASGIEIMANHGDWNIVNGQYIFLAFRHMIEE